MSYENLRGWFDYQDIYDEAVDSAPPGAIFVEIGVGFGKSIAYLAHALNTRAKKPGTIYGIDPLIDDASTDKMTWGSEHAEWARRVGGPFSALVTGMREHAPRELEQINLLRCRSVRAARMFDTASVWMVFVDGSHWYEDVRNDLDAWESVVVPGGIFAGHDFTYDDKAFDGLRRAVAERWTDGKTETRGACWYRRAT